MAVYLAASCTNPASAHPLFKQREITSLTHASIAQLCVSGRPFLRELAYDGYYRNIDVFLAATNRQKRLPTHIEDAELSVSGIKDLIPFDIPPIIIVPIHDLTPDQQDTFMVKLGDFEPTKKIMGKTVTFILGRPDIRKSMVYYRICKDSPICPPNVWDPQMFASAAILVVIITEFLKTNTYPAFINEKNRGDFDGADFIIENEFVEAFDKVRIEPAMKRIKISETQGTSADIGGDEDTEMDDNDHEYGFKTIRGAVFVAKPSPMPLVYNIGTPSQVPAGPGRVFPYFDRMIIPDNQTIRGIISSFFLRNLGSTRAEQMNTFKLFRLGWEKVAKTPQGGVLVHMLTGIKISLETQTRLFVVYREQSYAGFVLLGAMWSVSIDNRLYEWESAEKVKAEVAKMSSHEYAIRIICEALSKCSIVVGSAKGNAEIIDTEDVSTPVLMWNAIKRREISDEADEKIKKVLGLVSYQRAFREIREDTLCWLFDETTKPNDAPFPEDSPLYLPPTFSMYGDRLFQLLCSFGPDAPSLYNSSGQTYVIPKASEGDPNNAVGEKGKKALPRLLVAIKSVQVAYLDLKKVMKERAIKIDLGERAGKNRNIHVVGDARDRVYESLRKCLNALETAGDKRKSDGPIPDPKGKRKEISSADDLLSLF